MHPSHSIAQLYETHASEWDEDRQKKRPEGEARWIKRFLDTAMPESTILDLGCGSGMPVAQDVIKAGFEILGMDIAPSLIEICRTRFPHHQWLVGDMRFLDLNRQFGGIIMWHSFFHVARDDQKNMFPILSQHMMPGAPLLFTCGTTNGETIGNWRNNPLYHASLDSDEYHQLLENNGFRVIDHILNDKNCGGANIIFAKRMK